MSGTSADGVDVAIVEVIGRGTDMSARLVRHHHRPYPPQLRDAIFAFRGAADDVGELSSAAHFIRRLVRVGREISLTYAATVNESLASAQMSSSQLTCVAVHGQTLFHAPPDTVQWIDPALVAAEVGCAVVSDFRRADLAAGGEGAPLVPFADYVLFRHPKKSRVLLNLGGIANITYLRAGGALQDVIAFDTGPGNCISDHVCRKFEPGGRGFDAGGVRGARGHPSAAMRDFVLNTPYFHKRAPKSTDGPEMIAAFEAAPVHVRPHFPKYKVDDPRAIDDLLATACSITAAAVHRAILSLRPIADELIVSGGGTENAGIMKFLTFESPVRKTLTSDDLGVPSQAKEAIAFALLAAATLDGVPSNVPSVTGARRPVVLGSITPKP
jgi:anhydro-N-acetylmuramic acid kinase